MPPRDEVMYAVCFLEDICLGSDRRHFSFLIGGGAVRSPDPEGHLFRFINLLHFKGCVSFNKCVNLCVCVCVCLGRLPDDTMKAQ